MRRIALLFVLIMLLPVTIYADGMEQYEKWYAGIGLSSVSIDNDHEAIGNKSSTGYLFIVGQRFTQTLAMEMSILLGHDISVGETCEPYECSTTGSFHWVYYPADSAEYSVITISVKKDLTNQKNGVFVPWLSAGLSIHNFNWDTYWYHVSGAGPTFAVGLDLRIHPRWLMRLDVMHHTYSGEDDRGYSYDGKTRQMDFSLLFKF